jgi:DNA primase
MSLSEIELNELADKLTLSEAQYILQIIKSKQLNSSDNNLSEYVRQYLKDKGLEDELIKIVWIGPNNI